jgi:hypothetical protein
MNARGLPFLLSAPRTGRSDWREACETCWWWVCVLCARGGGQKKRGEKWTELGLRFFFLVKVKKRRVNGCVRGDDTVQ